MNSKFIKLILCLFTVLLLTSCVGNKNNRLDSDLLIDYKHYNADSFYKSIDKLYKAIDDEDKDKAIKLYDDLYKEECIIFDLQGVAFTNMCFDYTDTYWSDELSFCDELVIETKDLLATAAHELSVSSLKEEFKEHLNQDLLFEYYEEYVPYSDELLEALNKENELSQEYMELDTESDDFNLRAGEIFIELVKVRDFIAKANGYDNYAEYADKEIYIRDYKESDLLNFYQAVKDVDKSAYIKYQRILDDNDLEYAPGPKQVLNDTRTALLNTSDKLLEAVDYMIEHNLCYVDNSENNYAIGYTTYFTKARAPLIFNNLLDKPIDLIYQVHEIGHFANYYYSDVQDQLFISENYDISEVHSQAAEFLAKDNINEILGIKGSGNPFENKTIVRGINIITDACLYDEWQRYIYKHPDMTIEEIDELFRKLKEEYGTSELIDISFDWREVTHNFDSPMYYISYGTAYYVAFQILEISLLDYDKAIEIYEKILMMNPAFDGILKAINLTGLNGFTDYDAVYGTLDDAMKYLE